MHLRGDRTRLLCNALQQRVNPIVAQPCRCRPQVVASLRLHEPQHHLPVPHLSHRRGWSDSSRCAQTRAIVAVQRVVEAQDKAPAVPQEAECQPLRFQLALKHNVFGGGHALRAAAAVQLQMTAAATGREELNAGVFERQLMAGDVIEGDLGQAALAAAQALGQRSLVAHARRAKEVYCKFEGSLLQHRPFYCYCDERGKFLLQAAKPVDHFSFSFTGFALTRGFDCT